MGKSSKQKQRVVDYFMSMHFGICLATPNTRLRKILIGEKVAWSGDESQQVTFTVNQPDLFGGVQKEGGVKGTIDYLPGKNDQVLSPQLAARLGGTPSTVPGFRGITSIFFTGLQTLSSSPTFRNVGQLGYAVNQTLANADAANYNNGAYGSYSTTSATQSGGFKWSSNNPIIQSVWCQVTSIPETLSTQYAAIGDHANPAHIIYEALVDTDFGGNIAPSQINTAMFNTAAQTLYNENFGLSLIWTGQTSIEDFVKEILDHIQATLYINPKNGLFELKLLRADYIEANLRVLNVDNSFVTDDQRKFWGETANEIVVSWTNPENEQTETVIEQDLANIANQGAVVSTSKNYYGVRTKELAKTLAQRDLRQSAYPLASVTLKADRSCWDIVPGEVVKVDHSSDSISPMIMRVLTVDYGKIGSGSVVISLLEEIFSLNVARPVTPPGSLYNPNVEEPAAITDYKIFTPPAHWLMKNDPTALKKLTSGESLVGVLGYSSQKTASSFNLAVQSTDTIGNQYWQIGDRKNLTGLGSLSVALPVENSSLIDKLPKTGAFAPNQGDWLILGDDLSEICLVGALETNGWRIYRGMLDTIPKNWNIGSPFRLVPANLNILDAIHERAVNETCNYMLLTNTEGGQLSTGVAPISTGVASDRLLRPIRPANVQINGSSTSSIAVSPTGNMTITWANRNRYSEEVTPLKFTDGAVTPEYKQRTLIRVKTTTGVLIREYVHLWNANTYVIPCSWYAKYSSIVVEVLSERYGYESLSKYVYTITGLANNAGASDPPAVTAAGVPPPGFNGAGEPVSWEDLIDTDGTKPDDNATVGAKVGTNLKLPDDSVAPIDRIDNTQQQWTDVNNRPTTLAALDSAANTLVTGLNTEVTNARNGAATLLAAVQAAAQTATYNLVTGVPTQTSGTAAPTASAPNGSIYRQTDGTNTILVWVRENGAWVADYNAKSNFDSLTTTVNGHTTSISNLNTTTTNQATSITNLSASLSNSFQTRPSISGWTSAFTSFIAADYSTAYMAPLAASNRYGGPKALIPVKTDTILNLKVAIDFSDITGGTNIYQRFVVSFFDKDGTYINYASAFISGQGFVTSTGLWTWECRIGFAASALSGTVTTTGKDIKYSGVLGIIPANTAFVRVLGGWLSTGNVTALVSYIDCYDATNVSKAQSDIISLQATKIDSTGAQALINTSLNAVFGAGTSGQTNVLANYLTQANAGATYATIATTNNLSSNFANYYTKTQSDSNYYSKTYSDATYATATALNTIDAKFANYLTTANANSTYLTVTNANSTYSTIAQYNTLNASFTSNAAQSYTSQPHITTWGANYSGVTYIQASNFNAAGEPYRTTTDHRAGPLALIPLPENSIIEYVGKVSVNDYNGQATINLGLIAGNYYADKTYVGGTYHAIFANYDFTGVNGDYEIKARITNDASKMVSGSWSKTGNLISYSGVLYNNANARWHRVILRVYCATGNITSTIRSLSYRDVTQELQNSADILTEQIARANADGALTTITTNLTNSLNSTQSQLTVTASNLLALDGRVSLYYGMKLDGNGVTSFELMNGTNVPYGGIAKLTASKFLIYGDTIVSGTITGAALAAGSVTTDKMVVGPTTGARLAFTYNQIAVYDANNIARIQIGVF